MSILMSNMMVTKNPPNGHRKCFWTILVTFIFDVKIDINMCEPHYVNWFFLWTSSIVCVFDFLTFDIFLTFWHLFVILTSFWHFDIFFNLNHLGPSQGHFFYSETSRCHELCKNLLRMVSRWITYFHRHGNNDDFPPTLTPIGERKEQ